MPIQTAEKRPDALKPMETPDKLGPISAWSYSALKVFEDCAYRSYISRVKKVPEPGSAAMDRGTTIHEEAEHYVDGLVNLPTTSRSLNLSLKSCASCIAKQKRAKAVGIHYRVETHRLDGP